MLQIIYALTEVMNYIYKSLDEGNCVSYIYLDLKKAFDTVQHKYYNNLTFQTYVNMAFFKDQSSDQCYFFCS